MAATKLTKHHLINVPGGFVTLDVYGQEGEGGIPALYIHGGPGGNKKSFQPMAERIAEDRTVYLYDQIGCDDKSHTGEESLWVPERYVEELNAVDALMRTDRIYEGFVAWFGDGGLMWAVYAVMLLLSLVFITFPLLTGIMAVKNEQTLGFKKKGFPFGVITLPVVERLRAEAAAEEDEAPDVLQMAAADEEAVG